MNEYLFPLSLILLASVFQGTFGLGMKYVKPLAWEAWWLVHATVAMVIFPLVWAVGVLTGEWKGMGGAAEGLVVGRLRHRPRHGGHVLRLDSEAG